MAKTWIPSGRNTVKHLNIQYWYVITLASVRIQYITSMCILLISMSHYFIYIIVSGIDCCLELLSLYSHYFAVLSISCLHNQIITSKSYIIWSHFNCRIYNDETNHTTIRFKVLSTDPVWRPLPSEKPLEIFKMNCTKEQIIPSGNPAVVKPFIDPDDWDILKR